MPAVDPDLRRDKCCTVCRKKLPPLARLHGDPFCSNACCRRWHEKELP